MNRKRKLGFLVTGLMFLSGVLVVWRYLDARGADRELRYEGYAKEATVMVEDFLRTNVDVQKSYTSKGALKRVVGSGYALPGPWNLEGQFYLSMDRTAIFERGTEPLQVMVMRGEKIGVFQPRAETLVFYVWNTALE